MDDWEKLNETSLPKEDFYSHLDMDDVTDADYAYANDSVKIFDHFDWYVQSDTLLLPNAYVLKYMNLILQKILSTLGLTKQAVLKKAKVKFNTFNLY